MKMRWPPLSYLGMLFINVLMAEVGSTDARKWQPRLLSMLSEESRMLLSSAYEKKNTVLTDLYLHFNYNRLTDKSNI